MVSFAGAVLLSPPDTAKRHAQRQLTNLIRVGGRLAVLGVEDGPGAAMGKWHVVRPGSHDAPLGNGGGLDPEGAGLVYGTAMCVDPATRMPRRVVTNGYASDWRPPVGQLCPACAEQI